jgi:hypothetical protein
MILRALCASLRMGGAMAVSDLTDLAKAPTNILHIVAPVGAAFAVVAASGDVGVPLDGGRVRHRHRPRSCLTQRAGA